MGKRKQILGLKAENYIKDKLVLLKNRLKYSGSMVVVPNLIYKNDIEEVVQLLQENAAESVRIFLQGFTKLSNEAEDFIGFYNRIKDIVSGLRQKYEIPIIIEPSIISDLDAKVEGVIKPSPAYDSGIKVGDIILEINGGPVKSRVEAFNKTFKTANPRLKINRNGKEISLSLLKPSNIPPGFAVLYDIDADDAHKIKAAVERHKAKNVLIITSEFAISLLKLILDKESDKVVYSVIAARNVFFGGNIKCAGLLTTKDIIDCAEEYLLKNEKPDLILLPPIMFDFTKKDLLGMDINYIEQQLGITTDTP
jgi:hypothetical protein